MAWLSYKKKIHTHTYKYQKTVDDSKYKKNQQISVNINKKHLKAANITAYKY